MTAISRIQAFVNDKTLLEFENDVMLHSAVQYQFLIIGEAAGAISHGSCQNRFGISLFTNITM